MTALYGQPRGRRRGYRSRREGPRRSAKVREGPRDAANAARVTRRDPYGVPDLVFVKTNHTPTGRVEVRIVSGSTNFQTRILDVTTTFDNENDGTWLMADWDRDGIPDLVFVKTNDTAIGKVVVHIASGCSRYHRRILEAVTAFDNDTDGTWLMADWDRDGIPDLVFIKNNNTPSRHLEVHIADGIATESLRVPSRPPLERPPERACPSRSSGRVEHALLSASRL